MQELKLTDPIKVGYYAYHIAGEKIDDYMKILRHAEKDTVETIIKEGWSFISRTKKYKKGQKASIPKCQSWKLLNAKEISPPKITGIIIRNADPKGSGISCLTLRNAFDKLRCAMTVQDERDFRDGKLCVSIQIMKTPDQFKPTETISGQTIPR